MAPKLLKHEYLLSPMLWSDFEHFRISGSIIYRELFLSLTRCFRGTSSFQNPLNTHPKMVNACNKCQTYHFGGCFAGFPESVLRFGRSKSHFLVPKSGHFCRKCPFSSDKKWDFERPNLRTDAKNLAKYPPKWWI